MNQMNEKKTNLPQGTWSASQRNVVSVPRQQQKEKPASLASLTQMEDARSLTKLIMLAALALSILFVTACPSSSSGGGSGGAASPAPAVLMDLAAARVANSQANNVTLTWTQPTAADYSHVNISWLPTGGTTVQPLKVNKDTQTATIVGLRKATLYAFTAKSVDTDGNESAASAAATVTTAIGRVALFTLGTAQGNFGFSACQNALAGNAAMNTGTGFDDAERATQNAIGAHMTGLGYNKAVLFGSRVGASTTTSYDFANIDTDPESLGVTGQNEAASGARAMSVFTAAGAANTITETTVFGVVGAAQASLEPRTLANVLGIISGVSSTEGGQVFRGLIPTNANIWSFSLAVGTYSTDNCTHSTTPTGMGGSGFYNGNLLGIGLNDGACNAVAWVLCIAH